MGATFFDRLRGLDSGRIKPSSLDPVHGEHVFALGSDGASEPAYLSGGDFTEIRQVVDLTNLDFVDASQQTIGQICDSYQPVPFWPDDSAELFKFDFNLKSPVNENLVEFSPGVPGFTFDDNGDVLYPDETYSGFNTGCRGTDMFSSPPSIGSLLGPHNPTVPIGAGILLPRYTIQFWMNFDSTAIPISWGSNPLLLDFTDTGLSPPNRSGIFLHMAGWSGPGAHSWNLFVTHYDGTGGSSGGSFPGHIWDISPGWQLVTVRFNSSLLWPNQCELFIGSTSLGFLGGGMSMIPLTPLLDAPLQYMGSGMNGQMDGVRMLNRWLSNAEILTSLQETTMPPSPVNFEWKMEILIGGTVYAERTILPSEQRRWTDFKAPVRHLTGHQEIAFRLSIQEI